MNEFLQMYTLSLAYADILIIIKAITTVIILSVFYYHKEHSRRDGFRKKYPNLYSRINAKKYEKARLFFLLVPFMHYYFLLLLIFKRYNTVSFLKAFAVPKDEDIKDDFDLSIE